MSNYGVPYKGSKNKIAKWVVDNFPKATNFYDLFAGGCAVTHVAMLSGKYKNYYANDIWIAPKLFLNAINGKYANETRWISREEFIEKKLTDPYIQFCWSFGNAGRTYLYSREIEEAKHSLHNLVFFNDYEDFDRITKTKLKYKNEDMGKSVYERYLFYKKFYRKHLFNKKELKQLQFLIQLESLQSLQRLERLESLERLQISQGSYEDVVIKPNSVIYCDIPYKGTEGYEDLMRKNGHTHKSKFDYEAFYSWCGKQKELVIVSEYSMPEDFICVNQIEKTVNLSATTTGKKTEKLFVPKHQIELYNSLMQENKSKYKDRTFVQLEFDFMESLKTEVFRDCHL